MIKPGALIIKTSAELINNQAVEPVSILGAAAGSSPNTEPEV
jgi:hypothetical protein